MSDKNETSFTTKLNWIAEESLARRLQLEEPIVTLRLGAKFTKVEQAVFLPEVNLKIYNYVSCLLGTNYELLADHNLTDSRRLVWWPRGRPLNGSMDGDAICPRDGCSPWMIRPNNGFCFQKRQVTMQERRLKLEEMYQVSSCGPPQEVKACVFLNDLGKTDAWEASRKRGLSSFISI